MNQDNLLKMDIPSTSGNISRTTIGDKSKEPEPFSLNLKFEDLFHVVDGKVKKRKDYKKGFLNCFRKAAIYHCDLNFNYARVNKRSASISCYCPKSSKYMEVKNIGNCMIFNTHIKFDRVLVKPSGIINHGTVSEPIPRHRQKRRMDGYSRTKLKQRKPAADRAQQFNEERRESPESYITFGNNVKDLFSCTRMREIVDCMRQAKYEDTNENVFSLQTIIDIVELWEYQKKELL